jgi:hypothetical protein
VLVQQPPDPVTVEQQKGDEDADGEPVKSPMKRASERLKKGLVIGDNCVVGGNVQEECERRQDQQNEDAILVAATSKDEQRHRNERRGDVELFLAAQRPERNNDIRRQIIPQKQRVINYSNANNVFADGIERDRPGDSDGQHGVIGRKIRSARRAIYRPNRAFPVVDDRRLIPALIRKPESMKNRSTPIQPLIRGVAASQPKTPNIVPKPLPSIGLYGFTTWQPKTRKIAAARSPSSAAMVSPSRAMEQYPGRSA